MKKIISSAILVFCCTLGSNAQLTNGFYHIKNATTGRYISVNDTDPQNYPISQSGDVNMAGIRTLINYDTVSVSPSCVFFVKNLNNGKYDMSTQGTSINEITQNKYSVNITPAGSSNYTIWGTYSGITKYLSDGSASSKDSWMMNRLEDTRYWKFVPIDTDKEFIGIRPDVKTADGAYWGTIYASFNFRFVSNGMSAYYVSHASGYGFTLTPIENEVIPACIPVIIKCSSANPAENKIAPVIGGYEFKGNNWLGGVYCALSGVAKHFNATDYNPVTMRVLGVDDKGELAFIKAKPENLYNDLYLKGNKAYLKVNPGDADVMSLNGYKPDDDPDGVNSIKSESKTENAIFTLTGVKLPEGATPRAGIYIQNGKKVIIK